MSEINPFAAPQAEVGDLSLAGTTPIDSLDVSESWKNRFRLIEQAGGVKLPKLRDLAFGDRMRVTFNGWAFLFGFFYFAAKGMWRKGLVLLLMCIAILTVLELILMMIGTRHLGNSAGYGVAVLFASRANVDFYKKKVLGKDGWWSF